MVNKSSTKLITLSKSESQPIHLQIYKRFKDAIKGNLLKNGDRVPSTRALASELDVARGTVEGAYSMLLGEGVFISRGQAGTFINVPYAFEEKPAKSATISDGKKSPLPSSATSSSVPSVSHIFRPGSPAYDAFPRKIWSRLGSNRMRSLSSSDMSLKDPLGYVPLRESIASYLHLSRGVVCDPRQVLLLLAIKAH